MGFDMDKLNKMLNEILPFIVQAEQRRKQVEEQYGLMTEYDKGKSKRYFAGQTALQGQGLGEDLVRAFYENLAKVSGDYAGEQPLSPDVFAQSMNRYLPEAQKVPGLPENFEDELAKIQGAATQGIIALKAQDPQKFTDEAIRGLIQGRGPKEAIELMESIMKEQTGEKDLAYAYKQLEETGKGREQRASETGLRRDVFEYEKTPGAVTDEAKEDMIKKIEALQKQRFSLVEKISTYDKYDDSMKQDTSKIPLILNLNRKIAGLKQQAGIQTQEDRYLQAVAAKLKENGWTEEQLLSNQSLKDQLEANGIIPIILLEYY